MRRLLFLTLVLSTLAQRYRRQVTYQADEYQDIEDTSDNISVRPVTNKPLPLQLVYPGNLSNFFVKEIIDETQNFVTNISAESSLDDKFKTKRNKRSAYTSNREDANKRQFKPSKRKAFYDMQESRLHASYHKPSVSIMNDIPVEMSFDGAGFLRHEDDSNEDKNNQFSKSRTSGNRQVNNQQYNAQAINDFRAAFNASNVRMANQVKYDDEVSYQNEPSGNKYFEDKLLDHGAQSTENGTPFSVDFMTAFQHGIYANPPINYAPQSNPISPQSTYEPFQFYQNMFNSQMNSNTMMPSTLQQDSLFQNHKLQGLPNNDATPQNSMYTQIPQQAFPVNPIFSTPNVNMQQPNINAPQPSINIPQPNMNMQQQNNNIQQYQKKQRRKRSVFKTISEKGNRIVRETSYVSENRTRYSKDDRQEASSGFLPITGTLNGAVIQLNVPFYSPIQTPVHTTYSMPINQEYYRNPSERYYYPSEARRYSYGVLGSGNFEVIRGGVFPNERSQNNFHGGYQDSRVPYISNSYPNYGGTTEIILDGPLQGFQGFDNFNIQLINALSKHSELAVRPHNREDLST